ncbi:MAG: hypothetical protein U0894_09455 [Pirellulales bacterium]
MPILTTALAGLVSWKADSALLFRTSSGVLQAWYRFVNMPVVSWQPAPLNATVVPLLWREVVNCLLVALIESVIERQ